MEAEVQRLHIFIMTMLVVQPPAHADFTMRAREDSSSSNGLHDRVASMPGVRANTKPVAAPPSKRHPSKRDGRYEATAHGFGTQIPLDFAVHQIVPTRIRVKFAEGIHRETLVDWTGEQPWPLALKGALQPKGFTLQVLKDEVIISKKTGF
jgi:hypothetical protein